MKRASAMLRRIRTLGRDTSGAALLEFSFTLPILLTMGLTGAEITNYIITKMRISQIALHLADNAARIGTGTQLQAKTITEADINDLFVGAQLQSGELDLKTNGRVFLSSVEPSTVNTANSRIRWQRCYGDKTTRTSGYGTVSATTNQAGVGPPGRQVAATAPRARSQAASKRANRPERWFLPASAPGRSAPTAGRAKAAPSASRAERPRRDRQQGTA